MFELIDSYLEFSKSIESIDKKDNIELPDDFGERKYNGELPDEFASFHKYDPDYISITDKGIFFETKMSEILNTNNELTQEAQIEKQDNVITNVKAGNISVETPLQKGNWGEMATDQIMRNVGYERISKDMVIDINQQGHQGIDGVYFKEGGHPPIIFVDAKYGTAQLSDTADGKQMSEKWIDNRLDAAVGKEKADEIRMEKLFNPDYVGSYISHIDVKGNVVFDKLDFNANVVERNAKIDD